MVAPQHIIRSEMALPDERINKKMTPQKSEHWPNVIMIKLRKTSGADCLAPTLQIRYNQHNRIFPISTPLTSSH